MLLAHNHMMLILRAFLTRSKWELPPNPEKNIVYEDAEGRLSVTAVAGSPNGKELAEVVFDGLDCEVLSWQMDLEEPTAASIISQALNKAHELALRTTELTALSVLKGEIIVQMGKDVMKQVAFQTVREKVRVQLDSAAEDPDLPEVFDFLINAGVGRNTYIQDLLDFAACFVDSKKRQLRFSAFAVANKILEQAPLTKIAVMKRAYRQKPCLGFCPNPEAGWASFTWPTLENLEALLRFFHGTCKASLDTLTPQSRLKLLSNIDVTAADTFFLASEAKKKNTLDQIRKLMLAATAKYLEPLGLTTKNHPPSPGCGVQWICFAEAEPEDQREETQETKTHVKVLRFDEETGRQLNRQVDFTAPVEAPKAKEPVALPWRQWYQQSQTMGALEADKLTAVAVLSNIHENFDVATQQVDVLEHESKTRVVAASDVEAKRIMLPPCVPRQSKVFDKSEHPFAVRVKTQVMRGTGTKIPNDVGKVLREKEFVVLPEFKAPSQNKTDAAVAGSSESKPEIEWVWGNGNAETMHPFWAVRRLTTKQLQNEVEDKTNEQKQTGVRPMFPSFNCELTEIIHSVVNIATVGNGVVNCTRLVHVPYLTNSKPLAKGEELILQVVTQTKPRQPAKRTWRDVHQQEEKKAKKAKVDKAQTE